MKVHIETKCMVTISHLARVSKEGYFISKIIYPIDRNNMASLMYHRTIFDKLGYYRIGRIGNDSEYFERIKMFIDNEILIIEKVLTLCAHREDSLTNKKETTNEFGKNHKRLHQMKRWRKWHNIYKRRNKTLYLPFRSKTKIHEVL